ncbi:Transcription initiation factor TFIID subunit 1-B [Platanthera guangdongensis]|uniref:Transcription initiation factor TFIID subunit 1-B n=1 Tax=Platanthera guangdongensis TaxID=2320717 RepID=A0ABR2MLC0_9ASPA
MGKTVETKRKKKGRPSLLDLQKRSLRLQQQQQQQDKRNPNPSPNPYIRFPSTGAGHRRTRRNPITEPASDAHEDEGEDEETHIGKRREKKLKLVLRIHDHSSKSPQHLGSSSSESEQEPSALHTKRKIEPVGADRHRSKADMHSSLKAMESLRAEASNPGPTTPLPDKKLLFFILDILQKKDTYRVFSEPVDPEELPDYHEVIKTPMDFSTVRKKLSRGAYRNLEQFEQKDVFLISSNAMRYNAPDTIYYRQARTILDLAKKNFENLRQESDKEPETKTVVRRGRPPSKNINRPLGLPHAELAGLSKDPTLAIARGAANLSSATTDRPGTTDASAKVSYGLRSSDLFASIRANKVDVREDYSGLSKESAGLSKEFATRFGKRAAVVEENRRNTYSQFQPYSYGCEMPILSVFDGEKKHLVAVGLHMEFAYARSLSRFAAHLGSIGWSIAANKIEKVLPPGTKYGRGWVGENESPQQSQPQIRSSSPSNQSSPCTEIRKCSNGHSQKLQPSCSDTATPACDGGTPDHGDDSEDQSAIPISGAGNEADPIIQPKTPFQVHWNRVKHSTTNGFTGGFRFNPPSQEGIVTSFSRPPMCFGSEPPLIHVRERDMALRNSCTASAATLIPTHSSHADSATAGTASSHPSFLSNPVRGQDHDSQLCGPSMQGKSEPIPPDLNVRLQSLGSPPSGAAVVDSQQPDLALQL